MTLRTEQHGAVIIIYLTGEFDHDISSELFLFFKQHLKQQVEEGGEVRVLGLNCRNLKLLEQTAVNDLISFSIYADLNNIKIIFYDLTIEMNNKFLRAGWNKHFAMMSKWLFEKKYLKIFEG